MVNRYESNCRNWRNGGWWPTCTRHILLLSIFVTLSEAHVSITFPPSRTFSLDFLNSFWTKPPCGMPKGTIHTTLEAGKTFNATWHLGYAHQGGYRLELLDSQDNKVMDLTPTNDTDFYQGKITAQWHLVDLPSNLTCKSCTIRLLRQVPEFAPNFAFWSCSDVDIVSRSRYTETCSGHGYTSGSSCTCYRGFWGDRCQYEDECESDSDCNGNGKCIYLGGSALPRKQCFCSSGYFGERCSKSNPFSMPKDQKIDLSKHVKVPLGDRMTMYFKGIIGTRESDDEMEFVLKINGTSYAGLGWRPVHLGPICKSWPFFQDALNVEDPPENLQRTKRSATFTITKAVDQSDDYRGKISDNDDKNQNGRVRIASTSTTVTQSQSVSSSASSSSGPSSSDTNSHHQVSQVYDVPVTIHNIKSVDQSPPVVTILQESKSAASSSSQRDIEFSSDQKQIAEEYQPEVPHRAPSEWAAQDPFTPMDCTDIIMGAARGKYSRIRDAYARGRHTPTLDYTWGGRDDLTGATGWETNGMTTLVFRRKVLSSDGPDHSLKGEMLVIWARGQQPGETVDSSQFQLERDNPVTSDFYTEDEYKYHGLGPQRGLLYIDFTAAMKEFGSRFI